MNSKLSIEIVNSGVARVRVPAHAMLLAALLLVTGCAELGWQPLPPPPTVVTQPPPAAPVAQATDTLPALDVVMIAQHRQCEAPAGSVAVTDDAKQLRELMQWLKRSCGLSDATLVPQLVSLKQLRQRYPWPDAYAAWLDEWRRMLVRMQMLQQRAVTAEEEQANMVQRLRTIEGDLTTRP